MAISGFRNLPIQKYKIVGSRYNNSDDPDFYTTCDNCGKVIKNIVYLLAPNHRTYHVGTECVKHVLDANDCSETLLILARTEKELKRTAKFCNMIKKWWRDGGGSYVESSHGIRLYDPNLNFWGSASFEFLSQHGLIKFLTKRKEN